MQVGTELPGACLAPHRGDDFSADHEAPRVGTLGLADEFLHDEIRVQPAKGFDDALRTGDGIGEHHALPLRTFHELDDVRRLAEHREQVGGVVGIVAKHGHRQAQPLLRQQLQAVQFVARAHDRLGAVGREHAHHFELAYHGRAVAGDRRTDARYDGIEFRQRLALVAHGEFTRFDAHVAAQRVEHARTMTALARRLDEPLGRIELGIARQDGDLHAGVLDTGSPST